MAGSLSINEKIALLKTQPIFSLCSHEELEILAQKASEINLSANDTIVNEGEPIKSIYIIIDGIAEVSKKSLNNKKMIIAKLEKNESIGLSSAGFYSETGTRTATVTAITDMRILEIKTEIIKKHINENPDIIRKLKRSEKLALKSKFIKDALPFLRLNTKTIDEISNKIEFMATPENFVLFQEGDSGNNCYMIVEGTIEISIEKPPGEIKILTTLGASDILGEAALLYNTARSATATTKSRCKLLVITKELLLYVKKMSLEADKYIIKKTLLRSRPIKDSSVSVNLSKMMDGQETWLLTKRKSNQYILLSDEGLAIWHAIDGFTSLNDIIYNIQLKYADSDYDSILEAIIELAFGGFIDIKGFRIIPEEFYQTLLYKIYIKFFTSQHNFIKIPWVTSIFEKLYFLSKYLYTTPAILISGLISLFGLFIFFYSSSIHMEILQKKFFIYAFLIIILPLDFITTALHEFGHALTANHYKHPIKSVSFGFYLMPIAYCDSSLTLVNTKWAQIKITIAGIFIDLFNASLFAILAFLLQGNIANFFWLFSLYLYVKIFINLNPIRDYDFYNALEECIETDTLRQESVYHLGDIIKTAFKQPKNLLSYKNEIIYWLYFIIYFISLAIILIIFQNHFLYPIFGDKARYFSIIILPLIYIYSLLNIYLEAKYSSMLGLKMNIRSKIIL